MEYFKKYFNEIDNWNAEEVKVTCPFHLDTNPSASINTEKNLFHCWVCNIGFNEAQFIAKVNHISVPEAIKLMDDLSLHDNWDLSVAKLWSDERFKQKVNDLGLSDDTIKEFRLGLSFDGNTNRKTLGIPVFYNNLLVDVRRYNLLNYEKMPKVISEGKRAGWLIPYDSLMASKELCYLFEGEKDMLLARELGVNAYTLTGGALTKPNEYVISAFEGKHIAVCYDNDQAGKDGMLNIFKALKDTVKSIKYIDISEVVKEKGEDFYDLIKKYNYDVFDFYALPLHEFNEEDISDEKRITIKQALEQNTVKKEIKTTITVTAEFSDAYTVPTIVNFTKGREVSTRDQLFEGEEFKWYLEKHNQHEILELIETNAKDIEVLTKLKQYVGIPAKEPNVKVKALEPVIVYKSTVVDKDLDGSATSLDLYSFDKLDVGGQYVITYRIHPHPNKHQKLVAVCSKNIPVHDTRNFRLNQNMLKAFKKEGTVAERLQYQYQSAKHYIAKHLNFDLWLVTDLVFNSILDFNYGEEMRGALDVFILGDTQTGKSETTSKLTELYNFGHFLSLKTSTTTGLIGGSSKVEGSYCNTIGAIPRQHKRLVVLEEFSGAKPDFIKTMTDIRSSNEVRLTRVAGELKVPCKLRMITISNPLNDENGNPRFLNTFPNGIMPIMELIKSAEDVARYDGFLLTSKVEGRFNPFNYHLEGEPIKREAYHNKINWVATRQPENVLFAEGVEGYIWEKGEELNDLFECNFPLFGTTSSKKLARWAVALATLLVNVDESYENIIVTKEIVDYMFAKLIDLYSSPVFKLDRYAKEYKSQSESTEEDVESLNKIYARNATLLNYLYSSSKTSRANLASVSGMAYDRFSPIFNKLVAEGFIKLNLDTVYPTEKFRKTFHKIDKNFTIDTGNLIEKTIRQDEGVTFVNDLIGRESE